ncbi:MAG: DUF4046 domain-containing protein [Bacillota bacterium]
MTTMIDTYEDVLTGRTKKFPAGTWAFEEGGVENFKRCLRYLVLDRLALSRSQFLEEITFQFLKKWKLATPAQTLYQYHTLNIVNAVFPEWGINGWELRAVPPDFWNEDTIKEAIRHHYLVKLKWSKEDFLSKFSSGALKKTRLHEATTLFSQKGLYKDVVRPKYSAYALLLYCFPEFNFKLWEFKNTMEGWEEEDIRDAFNWLFKEKLKLSDSEIKDKISKSLIVNNGLEKVFNTFFRGSTFRVMKFLYPNEDWEHLKRNKTRNFANKPDYSFTLYRK